MAGLREKWNSKFVKKDVGSDTVLTNKEAVSYALGRGAQGISTSMMGSSYVNYFLTNILGLTMGMASSIRLWCGLWDAINDPILGVLVDKTRTKEGKMRPYIRRAPYLVAFFTLIFFLGKSSLPMSLKALFAVVTFIGWDMSYTAFDIPMGALAFSITGNGVERTKLYGLSSILRAVIGFVPELLIMIALMIPYFKHHTQYGYLFAAVISAVGIVVLSRFTYRNTKERATYSEEAPSVKQCFKLLFQNRPLFMLFLSNMAFLLVTITSAVRMYFAVDLMGSSSYILFLTIGLAPAPFIAGFGVPAIAQKLGKKVDFKKIYIGCCIIAAVLHLAFFLVCRPSLMGREQGEAVPIIMVVITIIFIALTSIPLEFKNLLGKEMEAETVDYVEWKTGERAEGVMLSLMSFTGKLTNSASSAIALFILGVAKYATHEDAIAVAQTSQSKFALLACFTLVPMFGYLLMLIPMKFYNITGEDHKRMKAEIAARKEAAK